MTKYNKNEMIGRTREEDDDFMSIYCSIVHYIRLTDCSG